MSRKGPGKRSKKARPKSARQRVRTLWSLFGHNENLLILINPDPDSIGSALAVKRLLWNRVHKTQIAYIGEIQRLDNLALIELLKIPMEKVSKISSQDFTRRILVDSQPHHNEIFESFTYDVIIDHHPLVRTWDVPFVDIRPGYGATATILIEYLRGAKIKPSMKLATALLYAIKTDTANFERGGTEQDVKQFRYLFQYANINILKKIETSELRPSDLHYFQTALQNRILKKKGIYAHLGKVPSPDLCVQIADFFTHVHGVGWSFVSGVYEGKAIVIVRNDGYRKDAGRLVSRAFGEFGTAGGHEGAARAEIPLKVLKEKGVKGQGPALELFIRKRLKF